MVKWPELVWSFKDYSNHAKSAVCSRGGLHNFKRLMFYRATGIYSSEIYNNILSSKVSGLKRFFFRLAATVPVIVANVLASIFCAIVRGRGARMVMNSLICSRGVNSITRWAAHIVGVL